MPIGFVHACEQNHLALTLVGGGRMVQLDTGKVVTNPGDPVFVYNYAFGVRHGFDAGAVADAFRAAGRDYLHVLVSPSSHAGLRDHLRAGGLRCEETQAYRRATGTGAGAPGLLELGAGGFDEFLAVYRSAWPDHPPSPERVAVLRRRFADPRTRAYRSAEGTGVFLLFGAGTTTQLYHLAVAGDAQGQGAGRRLLELAPGLVRGGEPLWLFTARGGGGDRAAAAAGWALHHEAEDWLAELPASPPRGKDRP